jgi:rhamnosyltransferase subunit B
MKMKNIVLVTKGSYGDLVPFLAIGEALKRRGNDVILISNCHYEGAARKVGLAFDSWDTPSQYQAFISDGYLLDSPTGIREFADRHIFPQLEREYSVLEKHCAAAPDTVVISRHMGSLAATFLAERLRIPYVSAFTAVAQVECLDILIEYYRTCLATRINAFRKILGLKSVEDWRKWVANPTHFLACWPDWFACSHTWPPRLSYLGFLRCDGVEAGSLPSEVENLYKPILITGGTAVWNHAERFYKTAMEACNLVGRNAIIVCRHDKMIPQPLLQGTLRYKELPFASLVPKVSAVIHHGGASVLVRALTCSVPQVAMPFGGDRPDNASRLEALGVCAKVPFARWNPQAVALAVNEALTSDSIASACSRLRVKVDQSTALTDGCGVIESLT